MKFKYLQLRMNRFIQIKLIVCSVLLLLTASVSSQQSLKQKTPLMGWASWNNFGVNINETIIRTQAYAMVSSGLAAVGYNYINIDDGFFNGRYNNGSLRIDSIKFPHGMKALSNYIHSKGLKAGFYSEAGENTCGSLYSGQPGGLGGGLYNHDQQDIDTIFKNWGYDFIKVDYCGGRQQALDERTRYTAIKRAIENTGRTDINYNVCRWQFPGVWVTNLADSWRISDDIQPTWESVVSIIDKNTFLAPYASQGHYNDMDMLEVGRGMTFEEDKSHFSMWCILSSPLLLGNNMTNMTRNTKDILMNTEVISVNQDTTGTQGHLVSDNGAGLQVWAKNLNGKQSLERAVVLFNRSGVAASMSVKWKDLDLDGVSSIRDLWLHKDIEISDSIYSVIVPSHGVTMLRVVGSQSRLQEVFEAEYAWINNFNLLSNTTVIANQGRATTDANCSGRAKASWLGMSFDNYIEFREVFANFAGRYNLTLSYLSGENRRATISINGKDTILTNLNSGGWSTVRNSTFSVALLKGYNTIRISNSTEWLPDLDKIQLDLRKPNTTSGLTEVASKSVSIYPNPCTLFFQIESESSVNKVEIFSVAGRLLRTYYKSHIPVSDLNNGVYLLKISTEQGVTIQKIVKL